ncbi:MAG TPA: hypothetical protein VE093_09545 [Polyangiaceae bacterium]|nr:hypothetical protein [Polyangiaceae bacterium]
MKRLPSLLLISVLALGFGIGCGAEDIEAPEIAAQESEALGGGDCSTTLGDCYKGCQAVTPTPTEQCFTSCDCSFYSCIQSPAPACGPGGVN